MNSNAIIEKINAIDGIYADWDVDHEWIEIGIIDGSSRDQLVDEAVRTKIGDLYNELTFRESDEATGLAFYSL